MKSNQILRSRISRSCFLLIVHVGNIFVFRNIEPTIYVQLDDFCIYLKNVSSPFYVFYVNGTISQVAASLHFLGFMNTCAIRKQILHAMYSIIYEHILKASLNGYYMYSYSKSQRCVTYDGAGGLSSVFQFYVRSYLYDNLTIYVRRLCDCL